MSAAEASFGLVLDLSHSGFAAVLDAAGEKVLASAVRSGGTRHDDLGDWLEGLLAEAGSRAANPWNSVAWICAGVGPGSFTGIRIALAFAQGVALPRRIPLYGFTSFEALFLSFADAPSAVAAVAANAGRFYVARDPRDAGAFIEAPALAALARATSALLVPAPHAAFEDPGAGFLAVLSPGDNWDYARIARHARSYDNGKGRDAHKPYYLQVSAAEQAADDRAAANSAA